MAAAPAIAEDGLRADPSGPPRPSRSREGQRDRAGAGRPVARGRPGRHRGDHHDRRLGRGHPDDPREGPRGLRGGRNGDNTRLRGACAAGGGPVLHQPLPGPRRAIRPGRKRGTPHGGRPHPDRDTRRRPARCGQAVPGAPGRCALPPFAPGRCTARRASCRRVASRWPTRPSGWPQVHSRWGSAATSPRRVTSPHASRKRWTDDQGVVCRRVHDRAHGHR